MSEYEYEEVTVKEASQDDVGYGVARVSSEVMKKLGLVSGDVIEILGKKKAATKVFPSSQQDSGNAILRIDGNTRDNLNTDINEKVQIRKYKAEFAKIVVIHPTKSIRLLNGEQFLSRFFQGRVVFEGQMQTINAIGKAITLIITKVLPTGIAIVTDNTHIELKEEPYEFNEDQQVSTNENFEDIGDKNSDEKKLHVQSIDNTRLTIQLRVDSMTPGDDNRGKALVDPETMHLLAMSPGDFVTIEGSRRAVAKVWHLPSDDWNMEKVRIESYYSDECGSQRW